jgi:hypothetical protein
LVIGGIFLGCEGFSESSTSADVIFLNAKVWSQRGQ